jgi:hypothetical protein
MQVNFVVIIVQAVLLRNIALAIRAGKTSENNKKASSRKYTLTHSAKFKCPLRLKKTAYAAQQTVPTLKKGLPRLFSQRTSCTQNRFYLTL